ncbi:MAG: hypothetical protein AB1797_09280 [bacterium]
MLRFSLFALKATILLIIISLLWPLAAPSYDRFLVGISNKLSSSEITLVGENRIRLCKNGDKKWGIDSLGLHVGLILVTALSMATPRLKLWQRLKFIGIVWILVWVTHVATLLILAGKKLPEKEDFLLIFLLSIGRELFPMVIWGVLSFRCWFPRRADLAAN